MQENAETGQGFGTGLLSVELFLLSNREGRTRSLPSSVISKLGPTAQLPRADNGTFVIPEHTYR